MLYNAPMSYRAIEIAWMPKSSKQWKTFTASRKEAARLWNDMVKRHHRIRCLRWIWPTKARWERWAKRKYPNLSAQSVQQTIADFLEAVKATRQLRKNSHEEANYPWRILRYRDVVYTNQDARMRDGMLILPNGKSGTLYIHIPVALPGCMMEVHLCMGCVSIVCKIPDQPRPQQGVIGVDLGVNTLIAATDGQTAILVSGREAKATVQWRNKMLASLSHRQSAMVKGSCHWRRLQRRKAKMLNKARCRMRDITHKATRKVADAFPNARCYVGKPFNDACQKMGKKQAQQVSSASNAKMIWQLDYKTSGTIQVDEAYSSQTCPCCGTRNKCGRMYKCQTCGFIAPRDVIGSVNIRTVGMFGELRTGCDVPNVIHWSHPSKYPGRKPGSSAGLAGNSS